MDVDALRREKSSSVTRHKHEKQGRGRKETEGSGMTVMLMMMMMVMVMVEKACLVARVSQKCVACVMMCILLFAALFLLIDVSARVRPWRMLKSEMGSP